MQAGSRDRETTSPFLLMSEQVSLVLYDVEELGDRRKLDVWGSQAQRDLRYLLAVVRHDWVEMERYVVVNSELQMREAVEALLLVNLVLKEELGVVQVGHEKVELVVVRESVKRERLELAVQVSRQLDAVEELSEELSLE